MTNGWTGGQYSLLRLALGLTVAIHVFCSLGLRASPLTDLDMTAADLLLTALATAGGLALAIGWRDRAAALLAAFAWLWLMDPAPGQELSSTAVALLLILHAAQPTAPFGSWDARRRIDPGGGWAFRPPLALGAWILLATAQAATGLQALVAGATRPSPLLGLAVLQLAFGPLALIRRIRPWLWLMTLALHLALPALGTMPPSLGMVMLYLFTFDPAWVPRRAPGMIETLFYDGTCGLCHRAVRFLLAEDEDGAAFRFAPLDSETFRTRVPAETRGSLPDSLVLLTADGRVLTRSSAFRHLLRRLGGIWRIVAIALRAVPERLQDGVYDWIARIRYRLFARPKEACPILPPHLRARFLA